jgi:hypothetical protein
MLPGTPPCKTQVLYPCDSTCSTHVTVRVPGMHAHHRHSPRRLPTSASQQTHSCALLCRVLPEGRLHSLCIAL